MTPVVLLPGMMCDARLWGQVMGAFSGRTVLHAPLSEADTTAGLARAVLAVAPPRFALCGLSMGGIVAMEIVAQAPSRVERLALLDTNPLAESPEVQARRAPQIARALAGGLEAVMRNEMKPNYLADGPGKAAILALCMDMALALGPDVFARQSRTLHDRPDRTATLAAYAGPALVLMGKDDRLCPHDRHELMHRLMPQSRFSIIEGAAHLPVLEQPAKVVIDLSSWLEAA
jgi:pimeloyl-ACP methyl ester carboxylesterase